MKWILNFILLMPALVFAGNGADNTYTVAKDHSITIHGTSNLHDWTETAGIVTGNFNITWNNDGTFDIDAASLKIDVRSIKSDHSAMDNNTYDALKANENPEILFILSTPVKNIQTKSGETTIFIKGNLSIAGVMKNVGLAVKVLIPAYRRLKFEGSQLIKLSDYNIDPPTALFGALKTGNEIKVDFKIGLQ